MDEFVKTEVEGVDSCKFLNGDDEWVMYIVVFDRVWVDEEQIDFRECRWIGGRTQASICIKVLVVLLFRHVDLCLLVVKS